MGSVSTARLVLVHGTRLSHTQWAPYDGLFPGVEVVTPDLPGHGARTGERFTTEAAVEAIADAVDGGDEPLPTVLAGHSLGGYMAMAYAAQHPERLAGLVTIGAAAVPAGPGAAAYRLLGRALERSGDERAGAFANRVIARLTSEQTLALVTAGGTTYAATRDAWAAVMAGGRPELLARVRCPVLVVGGQLDQLAIQSRRYAAAAPRGRRVIVPRATHFLPLTHVDVVARILRDFVDEVVP